MAVKPSLTSRDAITVNKDGSPVYEYTTCIPDRGCKYSPSCLNCTIHKCVLDMNIFELNQWKRENGYR